MNNIRRYREQANLTQEHIAAIFGIDKSTVSKWEIGDALPQANKLLRLAAELNTTVDDLLRESGGDEPANND